MRGENRVAASFQYRRQLVNQTQLKLPSVLAIYVCADAVISDHHQAVLHINKQLASLVEGRGREFIYHGGFVAFVDDEQTFITRLD